MSIRPNSTIRQTSIDCYNQIKSEGLLSKMRLRVYEAILEHAPCTSAEAIQHITTKDNVLTQSRARFTELRELGVIREIGTKKCTVTGRSVIQWDLTDNLPVKVAKTKGRPANLKKCIKWIQNEMHRKGSMFITIEELQEI